MATKSVGIKSFSINGVALSIPQDAEFTYKIPMTQKEYLISMQGVENVTSYEPVAGSFSTSVRYVGSGVNPSAFAGLDSAVVVAVTRDGVTITCTGVLFGTQQTVNPKEGTVEMEGSCLAITEVG